MFWRLFPFSNAPHPKRTLSGGTSAPEKTALMPGRPPREEAEIRSPMSTGNCPKWGSKPLAETPLDLKKKCHPKQKSYLKSLLTRNHIRSCSLKFARLTCDTGSPENILNHSVETFGWLQNTFLQLMQPSWMGVPTTAKPSAKPPD